MLRVRSLGPRSCDLETGIAVSPLAVDEASHAGGEFGIPGFPGRDAAGDCVGAPHGALPHLRVRRAGNNGIGRGRGGCKQGRVRRRRTDGSKSLASGRSHAEPEERGKRELYVHRDASEFIVGCCRSLLTTNRRCQVFEGK